MVPSFSQVGFVRSLLSSLSVSDGFSSESQDVLQKASFQIEAAESRLVHLSGRGAGYLYRLSSNHPGLFRLILRQGQSLPSNFELSHRDMPESTRLIVEHDCDEGTRSVVSRTFIALSALVKAAARYGEFYELQPDLDDPVFGLLAMKTGAAGVFEADDANTVRRHLQGLRRGLEDRILNFLLEKMGYD